MLPLATRLPDSENALDDEVSGHRKEFMTADEIRKALKDWVRERGTQKAIAEKMGTSPANLSRWLSGDRPLDLETLDKIMKAAGISPGGGDGALRGVQRRPLHVGSRRRPRLARKPVGPMPERARRLCEVRLLRHGVARHLFGNPEQLPAHERVFLLAAPRS